MAACLGGRTFMLSSLRHGLDFKGRLGKCLRGGLFGWLFCCGGAPPDDVDSPAPKPRSPLRVSPPRSAAAL